MPSNSLWRNLSALSENDLRVQVVIPLLSHTPGVSGVNDVHGRNEKGLDVIFFTEHAIRRTCYGLQLKRGDISGGKGKGTVKEVIDQLDLATDFDHPVAVGVAGKYKIDHFIVGASGKISETARSEIAERNRNVHVDFWDASEIVRRIQEHFPELLTGADAATVEYLKRISEEFDQLDALDQINGITRRTLSQVFEEPDLRRKFHPTLSTQERISPQRFSVGALSLIGTGENAVIVADQNEGKTSILRMLAVKHAREVLEGRFDPDDIPIPVIVRARDVLRASSVADAVRESLMEYGAQPTAASLDTDFSTGRHFVCIDGFSELASESDRSDCDSLISTFARRYSATRVIVAARPEDFLQPRYLRSFSQYSIEDFSRKQVSSLINRWTSGSADAADVARKMVDRVRDALQLPGSPIPAIIGVMLYEEEQRYITNTAEAVDRYMVIRLGRYAREMGLRQEVDWTRKEDLLAAVAFEMVADDRETLSEAELLQKFDAVFKRFGDEPKSEVAFHELVDNGVLVFNSVDYQFHRVAFRDFFAGKHVINQGDPEQFFLDHLLDRRWGSTLVFAAGLRRHNSSLLERINSKVQDLANLSLDRDDTDFMYAGYLIGKILSNSDASEEVPRLAALKTCLLACRTSIPGYVDAAVEEFGNIGELAALVGVEQTFFVTVGVPWLKRQFRTLVEDASLTEEERYLVASVYAQLHCPDWFDVVEQVISRTNSTRILLVLHILLLQIQAERGLKSANADRLKDLTRQIEKKNERKAFEVQSLLKWKSKLLELEAKRMNRLLKSAQ